MKKIWTYLEENLEEILMVILLAAFSIVMMAQVIARNIVGGGFTWAEEVCRYLFVCYEMTEVKARECQKSACQIV